MRLGVYSDLPYRAEKGTISTDIAFVRFVTALPPRVDEVVLFGRLDPSPGRYPHVLPGDAVCFVALPHYASVYHVTALLRAAVRSVRRFNRELEQLDAVWIFGPSPLAALFALASIRRGIPTVLGVRQDYPRYIGHRLPGRRWLWAVGIAWVLELLHRRLARRHPTIAVGEELARAYRRGPAPVLATGFSLVGEADIVPLDAALARTAELGTEVRILSVGRLDPEKNPLLLLDVLRLLRARSRGWRLTIVGDGPLRPQLERAARDAGLAAVVELRGYVPAGPDLWAVYGRADLFLHASLTEGLPQVLFEANAAGIPVVATDVGGVAAATDGGRSALLVPPRDPAAAAAALERLRASAPLRSRLVRAGVERVAGETIELQLDRIAIFIEQAARRQQGAETSRSRSHGRPDSDADPPDGKPTSDHAS